MGSSTTARPNGEDSNSESEPIPPGEPEATRIWGDPDVHASPTEIVLEKSAGSVSANPKERFGKYLVEEVIGHGGMGVVLKARDPDLNRLVAIKILGTHLAYSATARRRFLREARAVASISHPHVLTIHSVEEHENTPFIVMEYVSGQSLKEYVNSKGRLDSHETIKLTAQIAQGLAAAHAQGIIHRDVKPGNVMLHEGATRVRLADFGLARVTFDNSELTSHDQSVGTPAYMAPEQVRCEEIDARADLFSLGCVVFFMLTGRSPFQGRSSGETMTKIIEEKPPRLQDINSEVPSALSDIVDRLLQKKPGDRYQSAFEVAEECARYVAQLNQAGTDESITFIRPSGNASSPRKVQQRLSPRLLIACVLIAAVVAAGFARWSKYGPTEIMAGNEKTDSPKAQLDSAFLDISASELPKIMNVIVGTDANANASSIAEAVRRVAPGGTITLRGPQTYIESVELQGSDFNGVTLKGTEGVTWRSAEKNSDTALLISDVSDVTVEGIRFHVDAEGTRAAQVINDCGNIRFRNCRFENTSSNHNLSLLVFAANSPNDESRVYLESCSLATNGKGGSKCLSIDSDSNSVLRVTCTGCRFEAIGTHIYATDSCHDLEISHCVFVGGSNGLNLSYKVWSSDTKLQIFNNTFVDVRYWLGLMDSFRNGSAPAKGSAVQFCNNLILGGERLQGGDDQWQAVEEAWTFRSNWWEPRPQTRDDAGRNGRVAVMKTTLNIPEVSAPESPEYLRPSSNSPLLNSGVGGDFPEYIGAIAPVEQAR